MECSALADGFQSARDGARSTFCQIVQESEMHAPSAASAILTQAFRARAAATHGQYQEPVDSPGMTSPTH